MSFENMPNEVAKIKKDVNEVRLLLIQIQQTKTEKEADELLTVKEVAQLTGFTENTIYGYCSRNEIPYYKKGGRSFFFKSEILEWIKEGEVKANAELDAEVENYLSNNKFLSHE